VKNFKNYNLNELLQKFGIDLITIEKLQFIKIKSQGTTTQVYSISVHAIMTLFCIWVWD